MNFSFQLIAWYHINKRHLPWRETKDPYKIWLSEIILQQTRVSQGLDYYNRFVDAFPTIHALAKAKEETVLKLWQGLGYYSRARNLHYTAQVIVNQYKGEFPNKYQELIKLKGIGDYTASAIASICYQEPCTVVDGNVYRVLSRVYGINIPINTTTGFKTFKLLAQELLDINNPGDFNQALMEYGATVCTPKKPLCLSCIFNTQCKALELSQINQFPVKKGKIDIKLLHFNYLVILTPKEQTFLEKRTQNGIWKNLYQFPLIEKEKNSPITLLEVGQKFPHLIINTMFLYNKKAIVHKLSHRHLYIHFWIIHVDGKSKDLLPIQLLEQYPVPVVLEEFITNFFFKATKN